MYPAFFMSGILRMMVFFAFSPNEEDEMSEHLQLAASLQQNRVSRRQMLWLIGAGSVGMVSLSGCATSPVGGGSILVGMSEEEEKRVDAQVSPQQFSQDLWANSGCRGQPLCR